MSRWSRWRDSELRHRWWTVFGYVVLAVAVIAAIRVQEHDRVQAKKQACLAIIDNRQTIADLVSFAVPKEALENPAMAERTRTFLTNTQKLLSRHLAICEHLDVDTRIDFPFPDSLLQSSTGTTTTTTTTLGTHEGLRPPVTVIVHVSTSESRPSTEGAGTVASPPTTRAGTESRSPSTTTTTRPPFLCVGGTCLL